jgi:hypothetical protein
MDRPTFLVALDAFARAVSARAPGAKVGLTASVSDGDWCVYFNGPALFFGHTPEDLEAASRDLADVINLAPVLETGPHFYKDGALVNRKPLVVAGGPVGIA